MRGLFDIEVTKEEVKIKEKESNQENVGHSLHLLVWNVYKGDLFTKSPLPLDYQKFNLIFFQEFSESIESGFIPQMNSYFVPTFKWEGAATGVAIFSPQKLSNPIPLHTKYREPFILTPKSSLIATFKDITLINTHALNFVSDEEWIFELEEIANYIKNKEKVIWAGDFNTWDKDRTQFLLSFMRKHNLSTSSFIEDKRTLHLGYPVDWIFFKGLNLKATNVIEASEYSDHNPLMIEFN